MTNIKMISVKVPVELVEKLKEIAERNERSVSAEVRVAIKEYLAKIGGDYEPDKEQGQTPQTK